MTADRIVRAARLASGLVLMAFVAGHLGNSIFGLVSLEALERARRTIMAVWKTRPGDALLVGAAIVHVLSSCHAVASRRSATLTTTDTVQIVLGVLITPLLLGHLMTTRVSPRLAGMEAVDYPLMLSIFWQYAPSYAIQQLLVIVVVWTHGAIGLYAWLHIRPWWPRFGGWVLLVLFGVPILGVLGFVEAGKEIVARHANDPAFAAAIGAAQAQIRGGGPQREGISASVMAGYLILTGATLAIFAARLLVLRRAPVPVSYDGDVVAEGPRGLSILEISRLAHVPHASVCSGRGRCGTCRIKVLAGAQNLTAIDDVERRVLHSGDGTIRLACRARTRGGPVAVERLLPADVDASAAHAPDAWMAPPAAEGAS